MPGFTAHNFAHRRETDRQPGKQTDRQAGRQAGRQIDRQAGRQTDRQADRQAGRQGRFSKAVFLMIRSSFLQLYFEIEQKQVGMFAYCSHVVPHKV